MAIYNYRRVISTEPHAVFTLQIVPIHKSMSGELYELAFVSLVQPIVRLILSSYAKPVQLSRYTNNSYQIDTKVGIFCHLGFSCYCSLTLCCFSSALAKVPVV